MRHLGVVAILAAVLAGCAGARYASPSGEVPGLHVVNVDGPEVDLVLDDQVIATVACGAIATLVPGTGDLARLPWQLTVRSSNGTVLDSQSLADLLPQGLLIRGTSVLIGPWPMSYGPAPASCTAVPTG